MAKHQEEKFIDNVIEALDEFQANANDIEPSRWYAVFDTILRGKVRSGPSTNEWIEDQKKKSAAIRRYGTPDEGV